MIITKPLFDAKIFTFTPAPKLTSTDVQKFTRLGEFEEIRHETVLPWEYYINLLLPEYKTLDLSCKTEVNTLPPRRGEKPQMWALIKVVSATGGIVARIQLFPTDPTTRQRRIILKHGLNLEHTIEAVSLYCDYVRPLTTAYRQIPSIEPSRLGTFQFMTCPEKADSDFHVIYAYSYSTLSSSYSCQTEMARNSAESKSIAVNILKSIFADELNYNTTFYSHDFSNYAGTFIFKSFVELTASQDKPEFAVIPVWNSVSEILIALKVTALSVKNRPSITFKDSQAVLPGSLTELASDFKAGEVSALFSHKLVTLSKPDFKGKRPAAEFFPEGILLPSTEKQTRDLWVRTKIHLECNVKALLNVLSKLDVKLQEMCVVKLPSVWSFSGLSIQHYLTYYLYLVENYEQFIPLTLIDVFRAIRSNSYKGGLVHAPTIASPAPIAYEYDMASMYPAMLAYIPMPGGEVTWLSHMDLDKPNCFGFAYALVRAPEGILPCLLPINTYELIDGRSHAVERKTNICPGSEVLYTGLFFTEEIKAALKLGYQVETFHGYQFERKSGGFKGFIEAMSIFRSSAKEEGNSSSARIFKLMINSFYGRLAMNPTQPNPTLVSEKQFLSLRKSDPNAEERIKLTFYSPSKGSVAEKPIARLLMNPKAAAKNGTDEPLEFDHSRQPNSCLPIAAATTAYSRIQIAGLKNIKGNPLLYSDTDSVILGHPLDEINAAKYLTTAKEIGKLKPAKILHGLVVLGPKRYGYITPEGEKVTKFSGVSQQSSLYDLMLESLTENKNLDLLMTIRVKNYSTGGSFVKSLPRTYHHRHCEHPALHNTKATNDILQHVFIDQVQKYIDNPSCLPARLKAQNLPR